MSYQRSRFRRSALEGLTDAIQTMDHQTGVSREQLPGVLEDATRCDAGVQHLVVCQGVRCLADSKEKWTQSVRTLPSKITASAFQELAPGAGAGACNRLTFVGLGQNRADEMREHSLCGGLLRLAGRFQQRAQQLEVTERCCAPGCYCRADDLADPWHLSRLREPEHRVPELIMCWRWLVP